MTQRRGFSESTAMRSSAAATSTTRIRASSISTTTTPTTPTTATTTSASADPRNKHLDAGHAHGRETLGRESPGAVAPKARQQAQPETTALPTGGAVGCGNIHFSSATDLWATPQDFFDKLNAEFNFDLDVCATPENAKCARYFTEDDDGLAQEWKGVCWMNPPYGRTIGGWMKKAYETAKQGGIVVCLVPARTDTAWWHNYAIHGEITFIRGRLKFGGSKNSAPFPSAVVVFKP